MAALGLVVTIASAIPGLRELLRWLLERNMDVTVDPVLEPSLGKPQYTVQVLGQTGVYAWFTLKLINHRTDRKERIIGCSVELKRCHWLLWRKTIGVVPTQLIAASFRHISRGPTPVNDLELEPQSAEVWISLRAEGIIKTVALPRTSELVVVLRMVGPIRKIERKLTTVRHKPTASQPEIGSSEQ